MRITYVPYLVTLYNFFWPKIIPPLQAKQILLLKHFLLLRIMSLFELAEDPTQSDYILQ